MSEETFYRIKAEVCGEDREGAANHLRKLADLVMSGDAPGWTTSDVNGSSWADRANGGTTISRIVMPTCPERFETYRQAAAWMLRMGRALQRSNVPICRHISRQDNNANHDIAQRLIACGKRIAERYGENTKETKLRERLHAALSKLEQLKTKGEK